MPSHEATPQLAAMSTLTSKKTAAKKSARIPLGRRKTEVAHVQGSLKGTATLASDFNPSAPVFPEAVFKVGSDR